MNRKGLTIAGATLFAVLFLVSSVSTGTQKAAARVEPFLTIQIKTNAGNNNREQYGLFIQQDLAQIGIDVDLLYEEWGVFLGDIYAYDMEAFILGWRGGFDPDHVAITVCGWGMPFNHLAYNNSEFDALMDSGALTLDVDERKAIYDQAQAIYMDDMPGLPLTSGDAYTGNWAQLDGYDANEGVFASLPNMRWTTPNDRGNSDEIVAVTFADSVTLMALQHSDTASSGITFALYPEMATFNSSLLMEPGYNNAMISELPTITINADGSTDYTFKFREDMYWEDGEQITTADVEFTWDAMFAADNTGYRYLGSIEGILFDNTTNVVDDFTYTVTFLDTYAPAYYDSTGARIHPEHILNITNDEGDSLYDGIRNTNLWLTYSTNPLSGGAWYLDQWASDVGTVLKLRDDTATGFTANYDALHDAWVADGMPDGFKDIASPVNTEWYNADAYTIKTWTRRMVSDIDAMMLEFLAGNVDYVGLDQDYIASVQADPNFEVQVTPSFAYDYLGFNMLEDVFNGNGLPGGDAAAGKHFRKAMAYAIDRDRLLEEVRQGYGQVSHSFLYPAMAFYYTPNVYEHSVLKAWEHMAAAGFDVPGDVLASLTETETNVVTLTEGGDDSPFSGMAAIAGAISAGILLLRRRGRKD